MKFLIGLLALAMLVYAMVTGIEPEIIEKPIEIVKEVKVPVIKEVEKPVEVIREIVKPVVVTKDRYAVSNLSRDLPSWIRVIKSA